MPQSLYEWNTYQVLPTIPPNIILGWKDLLGTKSIAYLVSSLVRMKKSFVTLAQGLIL
jgi:hypothetical protein